MKKKIIMTLSLIILLFPISVFAEEGVCPLGPDVTKDLYGVLMILKIVAPLLCIGLSVFDAVKAVAKGDPSTDLKVVAKKFLKRMMYALILFFIPVLVDIFFQMADVWGANGTCDLMNPESNGTTELQPGLYRSDRCIVHNGNPDACNAVSGCLFIQGVCYDTDENGGEVETRTTDENCAGYTDKEHCDHDQKCYWDSNKNTCHVMNRR